MAKVSIIVPAYNQEKYLKRCLNSLVQQTKKEDIEILVINDGSTDKTEEIAKSYPEVTCYTKPNEGVAKTRNFGIEKASGDYILFVDADDYVDKTLMETIEPYLAKQIEIIKFKLQKVDEQGKVIEKIEGPVFSALTGEEAFHRLYASDVLLDSPCVYVIQKELFTKNHFQFQQTYHEDFGLIPLLLLKAKSIVSLKDILYFYVQVPNSIVRNEDYQKTLCKMQDVLKHYDTMMQILPTMQVSKRAQEDIKIYYTNAIVLKLEEIHTEDRSTWIREFKKRKFAKNIKVRNLKQLLKKILWQIDINLYLKMR